MSKKIWIAGAGIGVALIVTVAALAWVGSGPNQVVRFAPPVGDSQQYRIGLRAGIAPGESVFDRSVVLHSVVRYRVADRSDGKTTLHVEPRYMVGKVGRRTLFDSARADASEPMTIAMRDGFDLTVADDGATQLEPSNAQAWSKLLEDGAIRRMDQFKQQLNAPGAMTSLPARVGATRTAGGLQTLPKLKLTVTEVHPDSIVVAIDRAPDAKPVQVPIEPDSDETVTMTLDRLQGRMRIARKTGWIQSLALVADQTGRKDDHSIPLHMDLSMQALPDNQAAGDRQNSLAGFDYVSSMVGSDDDRPGYRLHLPESEDKTRDRDITNPKQLFATTGATFKVDDKHHELILRAPYDIEENQAAGHLALADLTLSDADGATLALPMVVDEMRLDMVGDTIGTRVSLRPLGWGDADLSAIHGVTAVFTRRGVGDEKHTGLKLADHATELREDDAVARAIPIKGKPQQWRVVLANGQGQFYVDHSQSYGGLEVRDDTGRRYGEPVAPAEAGLLDRVTQPLASRMQFTVKGDKPRFPLAYIRYDDQATRHKVTFTDEALRYRDRSTPPPDIHHIFGLTKPPKKALRLDDVAPRDADLHRLRLRLPVGVGETCELKAKAPAVSGHALVWQARKSTHDIDDADDDRSAAKAGTQDWQLATDDGVRRYFYDTAVDTTLHCPGQPQWQRETYAHGNTPWLVRIADVLGHPVDADTPAGTFFKRLRFLDEHGKPLRPMRVDAQPDDHLGSWDDEAENTTLADYLAEDGTVRFWGRVAAIQRVHFSGAPVDKQWHTEFGGYE